MMRVLLLSLLLTFPFTALAQDNPVYEWTEAGITLQYPAGWETPVPTTIGGQSGLQIAEVLAETPIDIRPPGIPTILLTISSGGDLVSLASASLEMAGIDQLDEPSQAEFLGSTVPQITGTNVDGQLYGVALAAPLNDSQILVVTGRSVDSQQADFSSLFQAVTASIQGGTTPASTGEESVYGVLWYTQRSIQDEDQAFFNLIGLGLGPQNRLYTYEADLGVVQLDATTGAILSITPNPNISAPSDLAVGPDGNVYVADTDCNCIFTLTFNNTWLDMPFGEGVEMPQGNGLITGFGPDAPAQLARGSDGALYATDVTSDNLVRVRVLSPDGSERQVNLDEAIIDQPLLSAAPDGRVLALSNSGDVYEIGPERASLVASLGTIANTINDFSLNSSGDYIFASPDQGVVVLDSEGNFVSQAGSLVTDSPLPGELVDTGGGMGWR